ncbi:unnamed protein product [Urochloa humidicola]
MKPSVVAAEAGAAATSAAAGLLLDTAGLLALSGAREVSSNSTGEILFCSLMGQDDLNIDIFGITPMKLGSLNCWEYKFTSKYVKAEP